MSSNEIDSSSTMPLLGTIGFMKDNVKTMEQVLLKKWKEGEDSINGLKELNEADENSETIRFVPRSASDYSKIHFAVV